jgi:glutamate-5-semialdehyde dehydrogenase
VIKLNPEIEIGLQMLKASSAEQRKLSTETKNLILQQLAEALVKNALIILEANKKDLKNLPPTEASAFRDRLTLTEARIAGMAESLRQVSALADPVNELVEKQTLKNGLVLKKVRAPMGIILMIFESRPNVILEAFSLAFKSGNSIILRGGSDSRESAAAIYKVMHEVLGEHGLIGKSFYGIQDYDREMVKALLKRKDLIDIVVPRGGERLIEFVQAESLMPIIKNDRGLCHAYIDDEADLKMALPIVVNGKTQRPGVCNSLETVLVHEAIAEKFIPELYKAMTKFNVTWRVDEISQGLLKNLPEVQASAQSPVQLAQIKDWDTEYLDFIMNCRVVKGLDQALEHIAQHGSKHSEVIVTKSEAKARRFQNEVDAAAVYWNASSRFTDGFEFGLGGELGISTQKLHVRGPVGLRELTTARWIIDGTGQIRE